MKNQYNIIIGLALLATIAGCYGFKKHKYFSIKTGEELNIEHYVDYKENDKYNYLIREESSLNYEAGLTAGILTLGIGFLCIGLMGKRKIE